MSKKQDEAKARFWQGMAREAARSSTSIREFCQQKKLNVGQFYWWRSRLKETWQRRSPCKNAELSRRHQGVSVHGGLRHAPVL